MKTLEKTPTKNLAIFVNPSNALRERTFVVLGVQRGGTSMVAGALRALGVDMGRAGLNHEDRRFLHASEATLSKVIAERNFELPVWGFKAPETTLQLDFLETALRNPHFICVTRNILAVVDSFMMRGAKNPGLAMLRVLKYYNRIGRLVRGKQSTPSLGQLRARFSQAARIHRRDSFLYGDPSVCRHS